MKPLEYVKKYKLNESNKFSHPDFVSDLTLDFISLVEWFKQKSAWEHNHFLLVVKQIRQKWDSISNKTPGELPETLWGFFYATVIIKGEEELFPEIVERRAEIRAMSNDELQEQLRAYGVIVYDWASNLKSQHNKVYGRNNPMLEYAFEEFEWRWKHKKEEERKEREEESARWYEQYQRRQQHQYDWFNSLFGNIRISNVPTEQFKALGITDTATEEEVKSAYRKLSMLHHPDKGGSQEKFVSITDAKNKCLAYINSQVKA